MGSINIFKPLSSYLQPAWSINFSNIKINYRECRESNPGLLGEKQECNLCAMQLPKCSCLFNRSYVVLASRYIEPGSPFRVVVTLFRTTRRSSSTLSQFFNLPSTIFVRILRQGTAVASETRECYVGTTEIITIKVSAETNSGKAVYFRICSRLCHGIVQESFSSLFSFQSSNKFMIKEFFLSKAS